MKGLKVKVWYETGATVHYYDANGNELQVPEWFEYTDELMPAVRVTIEIVSPGIHRTWVDVYMMFDEIMN